MASRAIALTLALLLGVSALVLGTPAPAATAAVDRIGGADRYETSAQMSRANPDPAGVVFLASGNVFSDALAAAPAAAAEDGRLLLTRRDTIPESVVREIQRLQPREIVLVGGEATIADAVRIQADALAPSVTRIGGEDRVAVSFALLERQRTKGSAPSHVWVVSGNVFSDALSAASVAARYGHGLVLSTGLNAGFEQQVRAALPGVSALTIAGGPVSVEPDVESFLRSLRSGVERIGGIDRYAVSVGINQAFTTSATGQRMLLASGDVFTDGLGGAVLAGALEVPMYLTPGRCAPNDAVLAETRRLGIDRTTALGGLNTVSAAAAELIPCTALNQTAQSLVTLINEERAAVGEEPVDPTPTPEPTPEPTPAPEPTEPPAEPLDPLTVDSCLAQMAGGWASQMAARNLSGAAHNPYLTAEARACRLRGWGENVGRTWGSAPDPERMMQVWMNSAGHRANILRENMEHIGVGVARGTGGYWYYVLDFGRR